MLLRAPFLILLVLPLVAQRRSYAASPLAGANPVADEPQGALLWREAIAVADASVRAGDLGRARGQFLFAVRMAESDTMEEKLRQQAVAFTLTHLGVLDLRLGRTADARKELERSLVLLDHVNLPQPMEAELRVWCLAGISSCLSRQQNTEKAEVTARAAVDLAQQEFGPANEITAVALNQLGAVYFRARDFRNAATLFTSALAVLDRLPEASLEGRARTLINLCHSLSRLGQFANAQDRCSEAVALVAREAGEDNSLMAIALQSTADLLESNGRHKQSKDFRRRAAIIRARHQDAVADSLVDVAALTASRP